MENNDHASRVQMLLILNFQNNISLSNILKRNKTIIIKQSKKKEERGKHATTFLID